MPDSPSGTWQLLSSSHTSNLSPQLVFKITATDSRAGTNAREKPFSPSGFLEAARSPQLSEEAWEAPIPPEKWDPLCHHPLRLCEGAPEAVPLGGRQR